MSIGKNALESYTEMPDAAGISTSGISPAISMLTPAVVVYHWSNVAALLME
jgi:hypothetical protein